MGETTVIHVRDMKPGDLYIGRLMPRQKLAGSRWSNPYRITRDQSRETAIRLYRLYIEDRPDLMASLSELRGKRLACWCAPEACHGDVLAELAAAAEAGRDGGEG